MNHLLESGIYMDQFGEEDFALTEEERLIISDKKAMQYAYNQAIFQTYVARIERFMSTPEGVREFIMIDRDPNNFYRFDYSNMSDDTFKVSRKTSKHEKKTDQTLFDEIELKDGGNQLEVVSSETMRFAVKHVNDGGIYPMIFNLICPEFYKVPGVVSPNGMRPDWISIVVVNEAQLESIKALL